jgi:hypothetical protein
VTVQVSLSLKQSNVFSRLLGNNIRVVIRMTDPGGIDAEGIAGEAVTYIVELKSAL